jgi:hypothetical protein
MVQTRDVLVSRSIGGPLHIRGSGCDVETLEVADLQEETSHHDADDPLQVELLKHYPC